jgi:alkylation response protein AidB-like acyl-CoA dehydrogenase
MNGHGWQEAEQDAGDELVALVSYSAQRMLRDAGGVGRARALRFTDPGFDRSMMARMGEAGWIGLRLPEAGGGAASSAGALCALSQELGAALAPEPVVAAGLSAALLAGCGADDARRAAVLQGKRYTPVLWQEEHDGLALPTRPDSERLYVPFAFAADALLVPVPAPGSGFTLVEVDPRDVEFIAQRTQDGGQLCTVRPVKAFIGRALGPLPNAVLAAALDEAALAMAATLLGVAEAAFAMTLEHLRTRRQFGQPIGSFQALRHRAADMKMQLELTRASVESAASDAAALEREAPRRAVSRAKVRASEAALAITEGAIQMHGAIGYTDEHDIGLYLRKTMALANQFGSADWHRGRVRRLGLRQAA